MLHINVWHIIFKCHTRKHHWPQANSRKQLNNMGQLYLWQ